MNVLKLRRELHLCAVAIQFYTRLPIRLPGTFEPADLNHCLRYFPLVGAIIGLICGAVLLALTAPLTALVAAIISVAVTMLATGAFHEDGLADMLDGLGGGNSRQQRLDIMKDSRIGTYGASALLLALALRISLLALLAQQPVSGWLVLAVICAAAIASRCCAAMLIGLMPYARDDNNSKVRPVATGLQQSNRVILITSGLLALLLPLLVVAVQADGDSAAGLTVWIAFESSIWTTAALIALLWLFRARLSRLLGGYTGDCLGALQQCAELVVLLILSGVLLT